MGCLHFMNFPIGLIGRKPVFRDSDKARVKPVSSASETSYKIEISPVPSLHMIVSKMRITKALIRLCQCACWSAPVLFANSRRQVFSQRGPIYPVMECHYTYGFIKSMKYCRSWSVDVIPNSTLFSTLLVHTTCNLLVNLIKKWGEV